MPGHWSRSEVLKSLPDLRPDNHKCTSRPRHADLGGVSLAVSHIIHLTNHSDPIRLRDMMTVGHYSQQLQASLDNTAPSKGWLRYTLEESQGSACAGQVWIHRTGEIQPLLDGEGLAPDLTGARSLRDLNFYVRANSVWTKGWIVRPIQLHELFNIWDYKGKLEGRHRTPEQLAKLLLLRLKSPLGKTLQEYGHTLLQARAPKGFDQHALSIGGPTKTEEVPFSPLELGAEGRTKAARTDDDEVDLAIWAPKGETLEQAKARQVSRRFAVVWWARHLEQEARLWLNQNCSKPDNEAAVEDCIRWAKAARDQDFFSGVSPENGDRTSWMEPRSGNGQGRCFWRVDYSMSARAQGRMT
eukprot:CCRYP_019101-RA/>CCRYP_019101-RA protein AED:0.36 eAED:0.44 QI:0/-1/0/1/-1/1/1/0/355